MLSRRQLLELLPGGLVVEDWTVGDGELVVEARAGSCRHACPDCGKTATSVHSRHQRNLHDFPAHGRRVVIRVTVRRFRCLASGCPRRTFAEPLPGAVDARYARRTARTDGLVHQIALNRNWLRGRD